MHAKWSDVSSKSISVRFILLLPHRAILYGIERDYKPLLRTVEFRRVVRSDKKGSRLNFSDSILSLLNLVHIYSPLHSILFLTFFYTFSNP